MSDLYWVSPGDTSFNAHFWATSSGGEPGLAIPSTSDHAFFDGNGVGGCSFISNVSVYGLTVKAAYTGVITQQTHTLTVGLGNADFSGGHFAGGSGHITFNGYLDLAGTDFTSTSSALYLRGDLKCSQPANFHSNDGTVLSYADDKTISPGGLFFNNLTFLRDSGVLDHQILDGTCSVIRNLDLLGGFLRKGTSSSELYAYGDVSCATGFGEFTNEQDSIITFTGTSSQSLFSDGGVFPNLHVNKSTSNQVKVFGDSHVHINGDFIIHDGTFNTNGHDIVIGNLSTAITPPYFDVDFTWGQLPQDPTNLDASTVSSSQINLTWVDNSWDEDGFHIHMATDGSTFSLIDTVAADTTTYSSTGLNSSTVYWYKVRATKDIFDSGYSNIADATTLPYLVDYTWGQLPVEILSGWWRGENNLVDTIGSNDATAAGDAALVYDTGIYGNCFVLKHFWSGTTTCYLNIDTTSYDLQDYFALSFWAKAAAYFDGLVIDGVAFRIQLNFGTGPGPGQETGLSIQVGAQSQGYRLTTSENVFYKIKIIWDGLTWELYLDDVLQSPDYGIRIVPATLPVPITSVTFNSQCFECGDSDVSVYVDEIKIYGGV